MNLQQVVELYLFIITGFSFWGSLLLARFFSWAWKDKMMARVQTIAYGILSVGCGLLLLSRILIEVVDLRWLESYPMRPVLFRTVLASFIGYQLWRFRLKRPPSDEVGE